LERIGPRLQIGIGAATFVVLLPATLWFFSLIQRPKPLMLFVFGSLEKADLLLGLPQQAATIKVAIAALSPTEYVWMDILTWMWIAAFLIVFFSLGFAIIKQSLEPILDLAAEGLREYKRTRSRKN
jgi:hypothetical protein